MIRNSREQVGGFLQDFSHFIMRSNVVDLAVAVIIGGAFNKIVTSLIEDVITPAILSPALKAAKVDDLANLSANGIKYGLFIAAVINFLVIALVIFLMIRAIEQAKKKLERKQAMEDAPQPDPLLVSQENLTASIDRLNQTISRQGH